MEKEPTYSDYRNWACQPLEGLVLDCDVQAFRAHGPGGQGVNTTDSAVRMTHRPSGLSVTSRTSRSQYQNRRLCLQKLQVQLEARAHPPKKRCPTKISRAAHERRLKAKKRRSQIKSRRRQIIGE